MSTPPLEHPGRIRRIVRHPLGWMLVGILAMIVIAGLTATEPDSIPGAVVPLIGAVAAVAVYRLIMRYAGRDTPEIARSGAGREALLGAGIGLGFVLVSVALIALFGGYSFGRADGGGVVTVLVTTAAVQMGAAVTEELMLRGLALQALERLLGSRAALAATAALFGLLHLGNPDATLWSSVAIAVEAGVLLGAAFLWRRSIWFVVGLHFAWNTTEELLGIPVSGHASDGLLAVDVSGPSLLSGGAFGLEASIVPVLVSVLIAARMLVLARRDGGLRRRPAPRP
ncbi:CPBP family intramembrane glutamic endopeptidase [Actinomadura fibrosa]|uniref:CPBP family intramembrane glutamic endopeptidase n=1 Tax=Actinomadura fibrosa TaxID=111802 RepID=A0ABW2XFD9_9ACTN|nr:type II CAAX endopeptidase family protein [Actinomadura fibrosa]